MMMDPAVVRVAYMSRSFLDNFLAGGFVMSIASLPETVQKNEW